MKKSEMYRKAQLAVLSATILTENDKLIILRELMDKESLELFCEKEKADKKESEVTDNE